jgi:succinate dehydrogenase / fumarate reductase, membrane anchor subunit
MSRRATGFRAWVFQRISAVYLGLYTIFLIGFFLFTPPTSYNEWTETVATPAFNISLLFCVFFLLFHAWVGIRDIIIDYVHPLMIRVISLTIMALMIIGSGLWIIKYLFLTVTA